jgi:hypothetical protein
MISAKPSRNMLKYMPQNARHEPHKLCGMIKGIPCWVYLRARAMKKATRVQTRDPVIYSFEKQPSLNWQLCWNFTPHITSTTWQVMDPHYTTIYTSTYYLVFVRAL